MSQESQRVCAAALQLDLGSNRWLEFEVDESGKPWLAADQTTAEADVWMKQVAATLDLRVHIQRTEHGLIVTVDQGDNPGPWTQGPNTPRLTIELRRDFTAEARASSGTTRELVLASVALRNPA